MVGGELLAHPRFVPRRAIGNYNRRTGISLEQRAEPQPPQPQPHIETHRVSWARAEFTSPTGRELY